MRIRCPCGQYLVVDEAMTRRPVRCLSCGRLLRIRSAAPRPGGPAAERPPAPTGQAFPLRRVALITATVGAALVLLMLLVGATWTTVVFSILCVALALQGLWLGAIRMGVLVVGMVVALAVAIPVGGTLAGPVRSLLGVPRLLSGPVGTALVAILLIAAAMVAAGRVARTILAKRPAAGHLNHWLGMALGALEGIVLSLVVCWGLALIQPVAAAAQRQVEARGERHPVAEAVNRLAENARRSLLGRAAAAANPLRKVAVLRITTELAEIAADEEALQAFARDPAIKTIAEEPEVKSAVKRVENDEELMGLIEQRDLHALLDNETIYDLATDPALRRLVVRNQSTILEALERARGRAGPPRP